MMDISGEKWFEMNDSALIETIGAFVKHHRLAQNKTQQQLAKESGINRSTVTQIENGGKINLQSLLQVLRVLNLLHVMDSFIVQEQVSPLLLAKLEQKKRKRARNSDNNNPKKSDW